VLAELSREAANCPPVRVAAPAGHDGGLAQILCPAFAWNDDEMAGVMPV